MDSKGRIHEDPTDEEIEAKKLVKIPDKELEGLRSSTEKRRIDWYKKQKAKYHSPKPTVRNGQFGLDYFRGTK